MTNQTERQLALSILLDMERHGAYSNLILWQRLPKRGSMATKNGFITALVYGVAERRLTLDAIIETYNQRKIDLEVRTILRMGLYQLLYMDRVTDNTAVNETVKLCYSVKKVSAKGFVNAILRRFVRDQKALPTNDSPQQALSLQYSCPVWLIDKWQAEYGEQNTLEILQASVGTPPLYIRVNTVKATSQEVIDALRDRQVKVTTTAVAEGLKIADTGSIERLKPFRDGMFYVQDLASQICAQLTGAKQGDLVYDLCAAPGSKSFTIAGQMENQGKIVAFDLYEHKKTLIEESAKRLAIDIIEAKVSDATVFDDTLAKADVVLCDVPCAGLGIIRRKPEIKYKSKESLENLPDLQYQILHNGAEYVKQGGRLVYSTCSLSHAENKDVVQRFMAEHPEFAPVAIPAPFDEWAVDNTLTLFPHLMGSDGFFVALFERK